MVRHSGPKISKAAKTLSNAKSNSKKVEQEKFWLIINTNITNLHFTKR